ncbi:MAG: 2-amino-4-hydroxy-6-hydroxymethyldihydropteridine diphosphokinase [Candidatus Thiodiazotropha sp. DIVDIV]
MTESSQVVRAWLSLGSNQAPLIHLPRAIDDLRAMFGLLCLSPVYESEAVGFEGDNFINLVVGIHTDLSPADLNERLKGIEDKHGRERSGEKYDARTLDIDLLTYGSKVVDSDDMQLPRDEILHYAFVLLPLSDVAGEELHPEVGKTYRELWRAFDHSEQPLWQVDMQLQNTL